MPTRAGTGRVAAVESINPGGRGWDRVKQAAANQGDPIQTRFETVNLSRGILSMSLGCLAVCSALFATGYAIYAEYPTSWILGGISLAASFALYRVRFAASSQPA